MGKSKVNGKSIAKDAPLKLQWTNRIVGYGTSAPDQLLANDRNARIHPKFQQDGVETLLDGVGWLTEIIVNKRTSEEWGADRYVETVVDGHLRVALAISHNEQSVPVKYVDLTPAEEHLVLVAFDKTTENAAWDADILMGFRDEGVDLAQFWNDDELAALLGDDGGDDKVDPGAQVDKADELQKKWKVQLGDVWECGRHRLYCGDSSAVVLGAAGALIVTDPPYDMPSANVLSIFDRYAKRAIVLTGGEQAYTLAAHGWKLCVDMVWIHAARSFPSKWTPIYMHSAVLGIANGEKMGWQRPNSAWKSVIELEGHDYERHIAGHAKSPQIFVEMMRGFSDKAVIDPFAGSGTVFVAAEQTDRVCSGIELDPKYCAVTLERVEQLGLEVRRVSRS